MRLPSMVYADGIRAHTQVKFGGYNHTAAAHDGEIYDMANMTGDHYPILASRSPRHLVGTIAMPNGMYARDGLWWVDGSHHPVQPFSESYLTSGISKKVFCISLFCPHSST